MSVRMKMVRLCLAAAVLAPHPSPTFGQSQDSAAIAAATTARGPRDAAEVESFFDSSLGKMIAEEESPGAVVVIVRGGRVLFAKGYGFANIEKKIPVQPEKTLFYLASVTKSFTATAVMQQVEQGRLDLDADVNRYLQAFQVQAEFGQPVTLRQLLTHTAGFDDKNIGYVSPTQATARPLAEYLAAEMPPRVAPPSLAIAYSNHGYGLAGHLVEAVSGTPYSDYIGQHILKPLGMNRSTAHIPLPAEMAADLATGYQYDPIARQFAPQPLGFRNLAPAGTVSATATDMARFLLAHLQNGELDGARILQSETARRMHAQQFTHHPRLPGIAFGFYERMRGTVRMLEHPGGYIGFATSMTLIPDDATGIFLATNNTSSSVIQRTLGAFLDHYYPLPEASAKPQPPPVPLDLKRLQGAYHWTRYSRTSIEKLAIWDGQIQVSATPQGTLLLTPRARSPVEWIPIEPLLFQKAGGTDLLAFRADSSGATTHFFMNMPNGFPGAFERLPWHESVAVQVPMAMATAGVFFITLTVYPVGLAVGAWRRRKRGGARIQGRALAAGIAMLTGLLSIAFLLGMDAWLGNSSYRTRLIYGLTPEMRILLWIPILVALLTLPLVFFAVRDWRQRRGSMLHRVWFALVTLAAVLQVGFYYQWNLLLL